VGFLNGVLSSSIAENRHYLQGVDLDETKGTADDAEIFSENITR